MQRRALGQTGEMVSLLGAGGFHLLEISTADVRTILNRYLDAGGNYLETAHSYGDGAAEEKIASAVAARRDEYLLASKTTARDAKGAENDLHDTLRRLRTDHLDIWFMHGVQTVEISEQILSPSGALQTALAAQRAGKIRFIGISGHGQPFGLLHALPRFDFDVMMTPLNYYDNCNFPDIQQLLLPMAQEKGTAIIAMKALADGYLWRSYAQALRYCWSLPVSHVVAGFNSLEMLENDLACAENFTPMSTEETEQLFQNAREFRNYLCRQCSHCSSISGINLQRIFELEGWYDRQMADGIYRDPEDFALRMRLGSWFGQQTQAREAYRNEAIAIDPQADYSDMVGRCRYGIDLGRKLRIAHAKLTGDALRF